MERHFQLSTSLEDNSPRNFLLPTGLLMETPRGPNQMGQSPFLAGVRLTHALPLSPTRLEFPMPLSPVAQPLSPMNGPRGSTPFQFSGHRMGKVHAVPFKENIQFLQQVMSPRSPQYQQLNQTKRAPRGKWERALLEEDEDAVHRAQGNVQHPPSLYPENIENFEPGSPQAWRPSPNGEALAYPNTPDFKQWLKQDQLTPKKNKATNKLGPERYKSLRVSGKGGSKCGKSAHDSQNSKRGEKLGTFYDPGFNNLDKGNFRTSSGKSAPRHPTMNNSARFCRNVPQQRSSSEQQRLPSRPAPRHQEKKQSLYKTELCTNWTLTSSCTYGNKCHFAHGIDDLKPRTRLENFKTQPCCDPAREGSRRCLYGSRCNYCHPGEAIRRPIGRTYYDRDYYNNLQKDFGDNKYPFGIYV